MGDPFPRLFPRITLRPGNKARNNRTSSGWEDNSKFVIDV